MCQGTKDSSVNQTGPALMEFTFCEGRGCVGTDIK